MTARTASVVGASGYAGGECLRLLADHPEFEVVQATSREFENRSVGQVHPNLRDVDLRFSAPSDLASVDVLFSAAPHGVAMDRVDAFGDAAGVVVDLSADFRLEDPAAYDRHYDGHDRPELLADAVYGLPELGREALPGAELVAAGGCNATAVLLGLAPLVGVTAGTDSADSDADATRGDPPEGIGPVERAVADLKVGSSEGGAGGGRASSHPERAGVVRPYAPAGHRHEAEVTQETGLDVAFTVHAVGMVRGVAATCHVFPETMPSKADVWSAYRGAYAAEPFVDLIAGRGLQRAPEPKAVAGTNRAEVGFALDPDRGRVVVSVAIDNLLKGAAGQAVQAANLAVGVEETAGLQRRGLHPVGAT